MYMYMGSRARPMGRGGVPFDDRDMFTRRDTFPHQDKSEHSPQRHTAASTATPTTTDTGNTVPQYRRAPTRPSLRYSRPSRRFL